MESANHSTSRRLRASSSSSSGAKTFLLASLFMAATILISSPAPVQAEIGHVDIVNAFRSPTQFTCTDGKETKQTYTALTGEIFHFPFNTYLHPYWDCLVVNQAWRISETRRFWGDDNHGGPELFSCSTCMWSAQEVGVYFNHDGVWRLWYPWNH